MSTFRGPVWVGGAPAALLFGLLAAAGLRAEEAVLPDGREVRGKLEWKENRLWFRPSRGSTLVRLDGTRLVRFPSTPVAPCRRARVYRVTLADRQRLTGEVVGLDKGGLRFRPAWGVPLTIPRDALVSLAQQAGFLTFFDDDFENGLKSWTTTGRPALSDREHVSGSHSLALRRPGQSAEFRLRLPLPAGRAGVNFRVGDRTQGGRWLVEYDFQGPDGPRVIRVTVAGPSENYAVEVPSPGLKPFALPRSPGWHRLRLEFTPQSLLLTVDDDLLLVSRLQGPGGALRRVRLVCQSGDGRGEPAGAVFFDDFGLARAVEPLRHQRADPGQDELWLDSGDQVLGTVTRVGPRAISMKAEFGTRSWAWGDVRGIFFARRPAPVREAQGEQAHVWLRTGAGPESDRLSGQVRGLDEHRLTLWDPVLGRVDIDRARLRRLAWVAHPADQ